MKTTKLNDLIFEYIDSSISKEDEDILFKELYSLTNHFSFKLHGDKTPESIDFASDMILKILNSLHQFKGNKGKFSTWVGTVCRNSYITKMTRATRLDVLFLSDIGLDAAYGLNASIVKDWFVKVKKEEFVEMPSVYGKYETDYNKDLVRRLLNQLPDRNREIIKRYYGIDRTMMCTDDIAREVGLTQVRVCQLIMHFKYYYSKKFSYLKNYSYIY